MNQFTKAIILAAMVSMGNAQTPDDDLALHFDAPIEEDVPIVAIPCFANEDGFGGAITDTSFTITYYYEMIYRSGGDDPETLISSFEKDSTNFLLQSDLFVSPCSEVVPRQGGGAQGISSNPPDEALEGLPCGTLSGNDAQGTSCVVVNGAFEVYYLDDGSGADGLKQKFENSIKNGVNDGKLAISHPDIVEVEVVSDPTGTSGTKDPVEKPDNIIGNPDEDSTTTPIIIGAVVGGVLLVGALALYKSRKSGASAGAAAASSSPPSVGADV